MKSHEYANRLKIFADFLLAKPEFKTGQYLDYVYEYWGNWDKEEFIAAVRSLGNGTKKFDHDDFVFIPDTPKGIKLELKISRNKVCRKVQEEKWECEPLFSPEEEEQLSK